MYNEYFGFKDSPFSIAPDPRYLYMTTQHRDALAHLVYGLNSDGGCILLTGEVGTGKTTICRCLLEQIPDHANVALVLNPKVNEIELLETICDELKIDYPDSNNSLKTYTDRIHHFLIETNRNNEKTVLIIDEAQNLDSKVLEQLRLLTNLETHQRKLLQIIILGQPELLDILAKKEMRQLAQRITARFHLQPLSKSEVKAYISHRLAVAGQNIQLFPENSIKLLYKLSRGIPRLINILCDRALLGAYVESQYTVQPAVIKKAAREVFGELKNVEDYQRTRRWLYPVAAAFGFAAVVAALIVFFPAIKEMSTTNTWLSALNESSSLSPASKKEDTVLDAVALSTDKSLSQNTLPLNPDVTEAELSADEQNNNNETVTELNDQTITEHTDYDNIDEILNDPANNATSAYQELFKTWNQTYNKKIPTSACKQAESFSLSCLYKQGNLNNLKTHNRPAVLTLVTKQGEKRFITITSIQDDHATIYSNNTAYTIKLSDLDKHWYGKFILLWKKPDHYSSAITPGDNGNVVGWLNSQFTSSTQAPGTNITHYNKNLIGKVKNFQSEHGLTTDGIVGPVTIIHLNTRSDMNVPTLVEQS